MNIQVRVLSAQAVAQTRAIEAEMARLRTQIAAANAASAGLGATTSRGVGNLTKWGSQLQWAGRQLQYNFTLPIILATGAATKFYMENEKAAVKIKKVYGDLSMSAKQTNNEITALRGAFEALSNHYGVHQKEVLEVGAAWAQAGVSGLALAKNTELTLKTMVLGEIDAAKATRALIAIQAQYRLSTQELSDVIGQLNIIENQTGVSLADLIDGFSRSAGVARAAGVSVRELGAMMAALVPAAGTASQAGNALKTIFSRLLSPTAEAADVMKEMGIHLTDVSWKSATATERLAIMADHFSKLEGPQRAVVSALVASRYQLNKFEILMEAMNKNLDSYYKRASDAVTQTDYMTQAQKELNQVLTSDPKRLERTWVMLQNAMADIIIPMIPAILGLADIISRLAQAFADLDPTTQMFLTTGLLILAMLGPLVRYVGAMGLLFGTLGKAIRFTALHLGLMRVETTLATGEMAMMRKGIVATTAAMLKAPFVWFGRAAMAMATVVASAVGLMFSGFTTGMTMMLARFPAFTAALAKQWSIMLVRMRWLWIAFTEFVSMGWPLMLAAARVAMARMAGTFALMTGAASLAFTAVGQTLTAFITVWGVQGMAAMRALVFRLGMVWAALPGIIASALAGMGSVLTMFATVGGTLSGTMIRIWSAMGARLMVIWTVTLTNLTAITAAFRAGWIALWVGIWGMMVRIQTAAQVAMVGLYTRFSAAMTAIMIGLRTRLVLLWSSLWLGIRSIMTGAVASLGRLMIAARAVLLGPWGILIAAVLGIVMLFKNQIIQIFRNIGRAFSDSGSAWVKAFEPVINVVRNVIEFIQKGFNLLPESVQNALMAVVQIVATAAKQVYEWMTYLNPFARHSPSLVENVTNGMAEIRKQFSTISTIRGPIKQAYRDLQQFAKATAKFRGGMDTVQRNEDRKKVKKVAPGAIGNFDKLVGDLKNLNTIMAVYEAAVKRQEAVVDRWKAKLDAANASLDKEQAKLDKLQNTANSWSDKLQEAQDRLSNFASTPIQGMKAMSDAIFSNEMAQKKLRLEMLKIEDVNGPMDDLRNKMAMLQGQIETVRGEQTNLRDLGAGSDILGFYDDQVDGLQAQQKAAIDAQKPYQDLSDELERLQRQGEILDLTNSLQFDPLTRQIDAAANAMEEMPFDKIMAGITQAKIDVDKYGTALDAANKKVADQQKIVDDAEAARDRVSARLDIEQKKLDGLKDSYQQVADTVRDVESALSDMTSAAEESIRRAKEAAKKGGAGYISPGLQNFRDAAGGKFADMGGSGGFGREGGMGDQSAAIDKWAEDLRKQTGAAFGGMDFLGPFKKAWKSVTDWWNANVTPGLTVLGSGLSNVFEGVNFDGPIDKISNFGHAIWDLFGKDVMRTANVLKDNFYKAMDTIGPELAKFKDLLAPTGKLLQEIWAALKPLVIIFGVLLVGAWKILASVWSNTLGPILDLIIDLVADVIRILRGLLEFVLGVLTGDWALAWQGIQDIVGGTFEAIYHIFEGAVSILAGFVKGIVEGVVDWFKWLYNQLVGHSIIPDIINGVLDWFYKLGELPGWIYDHTLGPIFDKIGKWWDNDVEPLVKSIKEGIVGFFHILGDIPEWLKTNAWDPIWNKLNSWWTDTVKPGVRAIKDGIVEFFHKLGELGGWLKTNAWDPIWNKLSGWWTDTLAPGVTGIKQGVVDRLHKLGELPEWLMTNAFKPIWNKLKEVWDDYLSPLGNRMLRGFANIFNGIGSAVAAGINIGIGAINKLIEGLNWIGSHVPGLSFEVSKIARYSFEKWSPPQFAKGGILPAEVGGGFVTNGARAIVGEGGRHPEYVIPTDPRYRGQATDLLGEAAKRLGVGGIGDVWDSMKSAGSKAADFLRENAVNAVFKPINAIVNQLLETVPSRLGIRGLARHGVDQIQKFASGVNDHLVTSGPWAKPTGLAAGLPFGNTYSDGSFHSGQDFPGPIGTAVKAASSGVVMGSYDIHGSSPYNSYPYASYGRVVQIQHGNGISSLYAHLSERIAQLHDVVKTGDLIGRVGTMGNSTGPHLHFEIRRSGTPINPRTFMGTKGVEFDRGGWLQPGHSMTRNNSGSPEPVLTASQWSSISSAASASSTVAAMLPDVLKSVNPSTVASVVADATVRANAAVARATSSTQAGNGTGGDTFNFYGDLEFPNISDGSDAQEFVNNLKALAGG